MSCKGLTQKDQPCKRAPKAGQSYCYQHTEQATEKKTVLPGLADLVVPRRVESALKRGPTKKDGPGHVYIYYLNRDARESESYWKIGCTKKTVRERLKQWKGAHLYKSFRVQHHKFAEKLIHRLLDEHRIYRYEYETKKGALRYHSIWKKDGQVVMDSQNRAQRILDKKWKTEGRSKHVEWFIVDRKELDKKVAAIVALVNTGKE